MHKHTKHVYIWIFLWIMYEYCRVIYQSFGCIDMLSLCIYESFELLIVNVGYEYERVLWTWVWYECLPFLLYLCVNLLVCLLWGMNYVWILSCDLSIIWMHRYAELVYIWIFWVVDSECWLWIWTCPVNLSLIWMFTFSVVFVCELVSMPTVGYVTCGCQRHTFFPRRIAPALLG